jgi:hypothetical protein
MHPQQSNRYTDNIFDWPTAHSQFHNYALRKLSLNMWGAKQIKERDGTQTNTKFDYKALYMEDKEINVYLIQQT